MRKKKSLNSGTDSVLKGALDSGFDVALLSAPQFSL